MAEFSRKDVVVGFGLITATVRLTGAVEKDSTPRLSTVCDNGHDPLAVKQSLRCPDCGIDDTTLFKKGQQVGDGFVLVSAETVKQVRDDTAERYKKSVKLTAHPSHEVLAGTAPNGTIYYLQPQTAASEETYFLLRDLIRDNPETAFVGLYTVTSRVGMYVARVHGDVIVLEGRHRASTMKDAPDLPSYTPNEPLKQVAEQLLAKITTSFDAEAYEDEYATKLSEILGMGTSVAAGAVQSGAAAPVDLLDALRASLEE